LSRTLLLGGDHMNERSKGTLKTLASWRDGLHPEARQTISVAMDKIVSPNGARGAVNQLETMLKETGNSTARDIIREALERVDPNRDLRARTQTLKNLDRLSGQNQHRSSHNSVAKEILAEADRRISSF